MTILAIDTSESHCSAALLLADGNLACRMEDIGRGHAERLLPMIEELLIETDQSYSDLTRVAVVTGPGTFTGLRIGLSVARGLALSLDIPCVGLRSLTVLAASIMGDSGMPVHVVTKGRGGQVFYQVYQGVDPGLLPQPLSEPVNVDLDEVVTAVRECPGLVGGSGIKLILDSADAVQASAVVAVDPSVLARLSKELDPVLYPPEPSYLRQADAIKAKAVFQVRSD